MKSIIIIGKSNEGKSTTVREICKNLKPTKIWKLDTNTSDYKKSKLKEAKVEDIFNNTFVIEVKGKLILICAGAPTEQIIRISVLIEICISIKLEIHFAIVSMRTSERREGFNTPLELEKYSSIVLKEKIKKVKGDEFEKSEEWKNRITKLSVLVLEEI
ncbi:hypothetical protein [Aquimarina agarilytica]|uniref:hypothetical protein n=1 Tax=Aquimarina agarilytica TaxID=1087449 RepID=UPI000287E370|nr:hypothetical protein [Aquimarina agarilytica]